MAAQWYGCARLGLGGRGQRPLTALPCARCRVPALVWPLSCGRCLAQNCESLWPVDIGGLHGWLHSNDLSRNATNPRIITSKPSVAGGPCRRQPHGLPPRVGRRHRAACEVHGQNTEAPRTRPDRMTRCAPRARATDQGLSESMARPPTPCKRRGNARTAGTADHDPYHSPRPEDVQTAGGGSISDKIVFARSYMERFRFFLPARLFLRWPCCIMLSRASAVTSCSPPYSHVAAHILNKYLLDLLPAMFTGGCFAERWKPRSQGSWLLVLLTLAS